MRANKLQVKVALADDVPGTRTMIARLLERLGHEVVCAVSNGAELVDQCSGQLVDVVFTDLDMPVMDGLAAAQHLAEKGIPVILVSGHADAEEMTINNARYEHKENRHGYHQFGQCESPPPAQGADANG